MVSVVREFVGLPSPTAARAAAGGHPAKACSTMRRARNQRWR